MSSFRTFLKKNQFIIDVKIAQCLPLGQHEEGRAQELISDAKRRRALVDTGATRTSIIPELAAELKLVPLGKVPIQTAGGRHYLNKFEIALGIPVTTVAPKIVKEGDRERVKPVVIEVEHWGYTRHTVNSLLSSAHDTGFDLLLGMDILHQMHITMYDRRIIISL